MAKNQSETMLPNNLQKIHYEHILPETPKSGSEWMKDFPDDTTREHLTKTLGNATLLIGSKNEKLGNKEFSDKREIYKTSSLIENRRLAENKRWTAKEIKKRSVLLAEQFVKLYK
ncbi:HNH endonuclease family protein [Weissella confusa]|uniref:HNH endonuclease family protein n=1 Tax=Weissella confusa TaxID=1583 RepID=UPI0021C0304C|nr:HNH endonuclease family protein [Weissella confusa]